MRFDKKYRTTLNFMTLPDANRTEMLFYRNPGADMLLEPAELDKDLLAGTAIFHFGSVSLAAEPCRAATLEAARLARATGATVSFDVNYRPGLWDAEPHAKVEIAAALAMADVVKVNETELLLLSGTEEPEKGCRTIAEKGPALCVATLGPEGQRVGNAGRRRHGPGVHRGGGGCHGLRGRFHGCAPGAGPSPSRRAGADGCGRASAGHQVGKRRRRAHGAEEGRDERASDLDRGG